jgi:hypothetical protein
MLPPTLQVNVASSHWKWDMSGRMDKTENMIRMLAAIAEAQPITYFILSSHRCLSTSDRHRSTAMFRARSLSGITVPEDARIPTD